MPSAFGSQSSIIFLPAGSMMDYGGAVAPSGWLMCDGAAVSRSLYPSLFNALSTAYGVGDGSTTFNLPDFRGRFARYMDDMGTPQAPAFIDATSVTAGAFVVGRKYKITFVGSTNFTAIGASSNTIGVVFTATGAGSGSGTALESYRLNGSFQADAHKTHIHGIGNHAHQWLYSGVSSNTWYTQKTLANAVAQTTWGESTPSGGGNWGVGQGASGSGFVRIDDFGDGRGAHYTQAGLDSGGSLANSASQTDQTGETRPINLACYKIVKY